MTEVDRNTLMEVLGRSQLDPSSELVVFRAAVSWAEAECERRKIAPVVENLRQALGPALQLIRFPLMDVYEFGKAGKYSWEAPALLLLSLFNRNIPNQFSCLIELTLVC